MTVLTGAPYAASGTTPVHHVVVPADVTDGMTGLFVLATASKDPVAVSGVTIDGGAPGTTTPTLVQLDARPAGNCYVVLFALTGLAGGQTLAITLTVRAQVFLHHMYQDEYAFPTVVNEQTGTTGAVAPPAAAVRTASGAVTSTAALTPMAGTTVVLVAVERTLANGTTVTELVSSGGEEVSQLAFAEDTVNPSASVLFASFRAATGDPHTATVTYNQASRNGYAAALVTTPVAATGEPPPPAGDGLPLTFATTVGTIVTGQAYVTAAVDSLTTPTEVRAVPFGYPSVDAMLAAPPFFVAHRGGSLDWPEMSLQGYTQSAFWGVGALEVSLARSSDGVWFGLHDETLDRTSGTKGFVAAKHTWAEISKYTIRASATKDPTQPARPYLRWEELIAAYYSSHVLFIDPKYALAHRGELLDLMDALPGEPTTRLVAKYYGTSTTWAVAARARGYRSWGYYYQADVPTLARFQGSFELLGMDYTASAAAWQAIMKFGKPVIAHILPDAKALATARARGAVGGMVSGIRETIPRSP